MQYISSLQNIHQQDRVVAGGKAINLGELIQAGLPVPTGFLVLTPAYERFVTANDLQAEIERLAQTVSQSEPATAEQAANAIRKLCSQLINSLVRPPSLFVLGKNYALPRQWILWRIMAHDLHHGGELAVTLGLQGIALPELGDEGGHITEPPLAEPS